MDGGSTVVVIEHDLAVIARADWVIDLGPGAGRDGGTVVFAGPPAQLVDHPTSVTARYLRQRIGGRRRSTVQPADRWRRRPSVHSRRPRAPHGGPAPLEVHAGTR